MSYCRFIILFYFPGLVFLRQHLAMSFRMTPNAWWSYLCLLSIGITGVYYHSHLGAILFLMSLSLKVCLVFYCAQRLWNTGKIFSVFLMFWPLWVGLLFSWVVKKNNLCEQYVQFSYTLTQFQGSHSSVHPWCDVGLVKLLATVCGRTRHSICYYWCWEFSLQTIRWDCTVRKLMLCIIITTKATKTSNTNKKYTLQRWENQCEFIVSQEVYSFCPS